MLVLVIGCGLSPLVFVLADRLPVDASCLELSPSLLESLEAMASPLPRPPSFAQGDITAPEASTDEALKPSSFDVIVDENVLDGMACRFPISVGIASLQQALQGITWLLQPAGRLVTISFAPLAADPYLDSFYDWVLQPGCALDPLHAASWGKRHSPHSRQHGAAKSAET
ncbi:unnamed protein product [Effrenium voratum]|nr:unnamed protein product [Effrenium voratum]